MDCKLNLKPTIMNYSTRYCFVSGQVLTVKSKSSTLQPVCWFSPPRREVEGIVVRCPQPPRSPALSSVTWPSPRCRWRALSWAEGGWLQSEEAEIDSILRRTFSIFAVKGRLFLCWEGWKDSGEEQQQLFKAGGTMLLVRSRCGAGPLCQTGSRSAQKGQFYIT